MNSSAPVQLQFSAASLIEETAARIVRDNADRLPDLSALTVVMPLRAAPVLKAAIATAAGAQGHKAVRLPRIGALADLAATVPVPAVASVSSDSERILQIYQALKRQRWFSPAESLRVARELTRLVDALSAEMTALPESLEAHARDLARAYAHGKQNNDFDFEARLTYDTWRALAPGNDGVVDCATRYALQLAAWAEQGEGPMYVLGNGEWSRREQRFFRRYAERHAVVHIDPVWGGGDPRAAFIAAAFAHAPGAPAATEDAPEYASPPDLAWLRCRMAHDVEEEAQAALDTLKLWLGAGMRDIAVVALDRETARRLRALAERDAILMQDEVGWPYSTTVCATALMRWLEARQDGFYHATVFDLLKSPFIFADLAADWGRDRLKAAVSAIEQAARKVGVVSGLIRMREALLRLAGENKPPADALLLLDRLLAADRGFATTRRTPAQWLADLRASLTTLGIEAGWSADLAGVGLIDCLDQWAADAERMSLTLSAGEWQDWLRMLLEDARFRDPCIESPVVLTSLAATRLRRFDGAIVLGAAAVHLPGAPASDGLFNQSVRHALGLRTHRDEVAAITHDLAGLLQTCGHCWLSWQSDIAGEPAPPAPWLHALMMQARHRGQEILSSPPAAAVPPPALPVAPSQRPAPALASPQVPQRISASGYQSLIDCPYQYFARGVLRLREFDDIAEAMDKRDFGELVHAILHRFHRRFARLTGVDDAVLRAAFIEESEHVFTSALQQSFLARAWLSQWHDALEPYVRWQREREQAGWQWQAGEASQTVTVALAGANTLTLEGRIDRVDGRAGKEVAVIDYKARQAAMLRQKLQVAGEDVQLPVYAALMASSETSLSEAAYLAIDRGGVRAIDFPDAAAAGEQARARLAAMFDALHQGAGMPAQGAEVVCERCEARGLCRRDHWLDEHG